MPLDAYIERMAPLVGHAAAREALGAHVRDGVRFNTFKTTPAEARADLEALGYELEPVPWCEHAAFVRSEGRVSIGNTWEHHAGRLFGQDAASLIPPLALAPAPGMVVADLCAAPGGKTTHLADLMRLQGAVLAFDVRPQRVNNLINHVDRWGAPNVAALVGSMERRALPLQADRVLVDAPCTNLGGAPRTRHVVDAFTAQNGRRLAAIQRRLLATAFSACRVGGRIAYSTCTLDPLENEAVATWFAREFPVRVVPIELPGLSESRGAETYPGLEIDPGVARASVRLWPGALATEGFYCALFEKTDEGQPPALRPRAPKPYGYHLAGSAADALPAKHALVEGATVLRRKTRLHLTTIPAEVLPTVVAMGPERIGIDAAEDLDGGTRLTFEAATLLGSGQAGIELDPQDAGTFVTGRPVPHPDRAGWSVVTCRGHALGCSRTFGPQLEPYIPKERRVADGIGAAGFLERIRLSGDAAP